MRRVDSRYLREFLPAIAAYTVLIIAAGLTLDRVHGTVARAILALLPLLPTVFVARAIVRRIRDGDELERRVHLEAISVAALTVGLTSFGVGLLESAKMLDLHAGLVWVFPALIAVWGIALFFARRRYRDG